MVKRLKGSNVNIPEESLLHRIYKIKVHIRSMSNRRATILNVRKNVRLVMKGKIF